MTDKKPIKFTKEFLGNKDEYTKPTARKATPSGGCERDPPRRIERQGKKAKPLGFEKGGRVKSTGDAKLHKGEVVLPKELVKKFMKLMK